MEYAIIILIFAAVIGAIWFISVKGGFKSGSGSLERQLLAAEHGDVFAQYELAKRYHEGNDNDWQLIPIGQLTRLLKNPWKVSHLPGLISILPCSYCIHPTNPS